MKKKIIWLLVLVVIGGALFLARSQMPAKNIQPLTEEQQVRALVAELGKRLHQVSILAPTAVADIEKYYGDLISPELLAGWQKDPQRAPGLVTPNAWPDRIEIKQVERADDGAYDVQGQVIEVSRAGGSPVSSYSIIFKIRNRDGRWLITGCVKLVQQ